jgi:signal transduction histidine kinase
VTTAEIGHTGRVAHPTSSGGDGSGSTVPAAAAPRSGAMKAAAPVAERHEFWRRALAGWDAAFYALLVMSAFSMVAVDATWPPSLDVRLALGSLVVLLAAYLLLGRRGAVRGDTRLTRGYLAVLITVVVLCSGVSSVGSILLFVGFSQVWFFSDTLRGGIAASVLLAVTTCAAIAFEISATGSDLLQLAGQMGVGLIFSLALGLWITRVAEQSEERAGLIERLEAAQAQLAASNHAAGVLAERERLAQEIHDTLAQGFTSVVMLAQTTQAQLDAGQDEAARGRVAQIEQVARDNLAEARALVAAFGPAALADGTLAEALTRLGERFGAETGVAVDVRLSTTGAVGRDTEVVLLRAAQEALANVRKHAHADRVRLTLSGDAGQVTLEVQDDGDGVPSAVAEGVGLRGMRERAAGAGGTLVVAGRAGSGTCLRLTLPVGGAATGAAAGTGAVSGLAATDGVVGA